MTYVEYIVLALRCVWWDQVLRGEHGADSEWMRRNNGYMFVAVYLACVSVVVAGRRLLCA